MILLVRVSSESQFLGLRFESQRGSLAGNVEQVESKGVIGRPCFFVNEKKLKRKSTVIITRREFVRQDAVGTPAPLSLTFLNTKYAKSAARLPQKIAGSCMCVCMWLCECPSGHLTASQ